MTLSTLILLFAAVGLVLTLIVKAFKRLESWPISFLQNFVGAWFIFSGAVKAVDPLGTAYKMEQYFGELETTFAGSGMSFLAPLFPWLAQHVNAFSVFMIVLEIVLGAMLIIGANRKLVAWTLFITLVFFTFLTGFTYLTGYVPEGVNFFQFGKWGPYVETNMKVTDCGCFGDFIKLKPKTSFIKDIFLLIPGIWFLLASGKIPRLFTRLYRSGIVTLGIVGSTIYCISNYVWNLPDVDFRPFYIGNNIRDQKQRETEAQQNVKVISYKLTNKASGQIVEIPYEQFMAEFKNYPKEDWTFEQIKSEPEIEHTKISDFEVSDLEGNNVTEDILNNPDYAIMIVAYKLYGTSESQELMRYDSVFLTDSLGQPTGILASVDSITTQSEIFHPDKKYLMPWHNAACPLIQEAAAAGIKTYVISGYAGPERFAQFQQAAGCNTTFFTADDILLKTIVRSNPGFVLMKDGKIVHKWHHKKLPEFAEIQARFMQ